MRSLCPEPYLPRVELILQDDLALSRKQRHTAKRIWERLQMGAPGYENHLLYRRRKALPCRLADRFHLLASGSGNILFRQRNFQTRAESMRWGRIIDLDDASPLSFRHVGYLPPLVGICGQRNDRLFLPRFDLETHRKTSNRSNGAI